MDVKDIAIVIGSLVPLCGACVGALRFFVKAEFSALVEKLDARYVKREVSDEKEKLIHERIERLERASWS